MSVSDPLPSRVEALVRLYLPRLREGVEDSLPDALAIPLADYASRVERGLLDAARGLAGAVVALVGVDESHDVEG